MKRVAIAGASGYSGEVLLHLLSRHPQVKLASVTSRSLAGQRVADAMPGMRGRLDHLEFSSSCPEELVRQKDLDLVFLALPHGVAGTFATPLVAAGIRVIDLSADFRLSSAATYSEFYGGEHSDPELLAASPYVIPELESSSWVEAPLIASPGCYPTGILVPLAPLIRERLIAAEGIVITSFSGVSGAGRKADQFYSFCEREGNALAYGSPRHRHLSEIEEQLSRWAGNSVIVQFTPHLAPMNRGIITTIVVRPNCAGLEDLYATWNRQYQSAPFVVVLESGNFPASADVWGTNRIDISAVKDPRTGNFVIFSALDNLMKGASGQAVQIMNRLFGFPETAGLI